MLLLDTHVLIWLDEGSQRLGGKARNRIDRALIEGRINVSAISFWETAMLVNKHRLEIKMGIDAWRKSLIENGLQEIPLDGVTGIRAAELKDFHGDPADRMIVATALETGATLMTADEKILTWKEGPGHGFIACDANR